MNQIQISRRRLMGMSAAALLSAGLWPGALAAQDALAPDVLFTCVNDLHYIDERCLPFFQHTVEKMKEAQPTAKLLLVVGDLCENGTPKQHAAMRDILKTTGRDTRVVIGNHDWTAQNDRAAFEQNWPGSLNYTFEFGGWQFVALDTSDGVKYENTSVLAPTLQWVDQTLPKLDKKRPMILYTHFPLGESVRYRLANADALLDRFKEFNLRAIFNGHYHAFTQHKGGGDFLITTDKCCAYRRDNHDGTPEKGFFICTTNSGSVQRQFVEVSRQPAPKIN